MRRVKGNVRALESNGIPSGRHQVRYTVDGQRKSLGTYPSRKLADAALCKLLHELDTGTYHDAARGDVLFRDFAPKALGAMDIAPRTREVYASLLGKWLMPTFGDLSLNSITPLTVDLWWIRVTTGKVNRRNGYYLLRSVMRRAVKDGLLRESPCRVEKAGRDVAKPRPTLSMVQFRAIRDASTIPTVLDVLFAGHLRVAELVALNYGDVDLKEGRLTVSKQMQQIAGQGLVERETTTGTERTVYLLQEGLDALVSHFAVKPGLPLAPLFVGARGRRISSGTLSREWNRAREAVGLGWAHLHDIRHCSLTAVAPGASLYELMARAGHTTAAASLRYQHASADRDREVARQASARLCASQSELRSVE